VKRLGADIPPLFHTQIAADESTMYTWKEA
jgi:hypothetical protein